MRRYRHPGDLPGTLPVFPLKGVVLFPRGVLPLNVFEPRYLAMTDSALADQRLIGMIQPTTDSDDRPPLSAVGCAGRITSFQETDDGRYVIALTGICRFRVKSERDEAGPYRQIVPDFQAFAADLSESPDTDFPRERLAAALKTYLAERDFKADWQSVVHAPAESLVNALSMLCPFEPAEKQALLEARDLNERAHTLLTLLEMAGIPAAGTRIN